MRNSLLIVGLVLICRPAVARTPYCTFDWSWSGYSRVPVYIHQDLADHLKHIGGAYWTDDELQNEVEATIYTLQEYIATGMPTLEFAGFTSNNWDTGIPGAVMLAPWLGTSSCGSHATGDMHGSPSGGVWIHIKRSDSVPGGEDCGFPYEHTRSNPPYDGAHDLRGLLNHELLHTSGGPARWGAVSKPASRKVNRPVIIGSSSRPPC